MNWYLKVLKNYATFKGRARRKEYWMFVLFHCLVVFALTFLVALLTGETDGSVAGDLYILATFLPALAVSARRMHDTGRSGWWLLVPLVPIVWLCMDGDRGTNGYGADPKAG